MLRSTNDLLNLAIGVTDGDIGDVKDLYFDDESWTIRYLVVETGSWLFSRKVLISPIAAGKPDWASKLLPVSLTQDQVKNSPDIDTDMPVTRQRETDYFDYYSYPYYWGGTGLWGAGMSPGLLVPGYADYGADTAVHARADMVQAQAQARQRDQDPHLRSCKAVIGYHIAAADGEIGHVQDMLVDEDSWAIRYLVLSTSNWWPGREVLVSPQWIKGVNWGDQTVGVDLTRVTLKQAPPYDPALPFSREMEIAVFKHYGRPGYWSGGSVSESHVLNRHED